MSHIVIDKKHHVAQICLARADALNALNLSMVSTIKDALESWLDDDEVSCIVITSSSPRAFCAGGDVREAVSLIKQKPELSAEPYFRAEYGLDLLIANYPKPIIALVDGIVMGGGLGLARLSKYMVISPQIKCAMPETAIGLFPDVGASYFLRCLPESAILMMGMTGTILEAGDIIRWRLADYITSSAHFDAIIHDLQSADMITDDVIKNIISSYGIDSPKAKFADHMDLIEAVFNQDTPQAIAQAASQWASSANEGREIATTWANALHHKCTTSICLFWAMIRRLAVPLSVSEAIQRDFHFACKMMRRPDFVEGVRAVLLDKDNQPQWEPATLEAVDDDLLASLCDFTSMPLLPLPLFLLKTNN